MTAVKSLIIIIPLLLCACNNSTSPSSSGSAPLAFYSLDSISVTEIHPGGATTSVITKDSLLKIDQKLIAFSGTSSFISNNDYSFRNGKVYRTCHTFAYYDQPMDIIDSGNYSYNDTILTIDTITSVPQISIVKTSCLVFNYDILHLSTCFLVVEVYKSGFGRVNMYDYISNSGLEEIKDSLNAATNDSVIYIKYVQFLSSK